jgi:uncharacterized protein
MKRMIATALLASAVMAHAQTTAIPNAPAAPASPAKKELVQKLMALQQPALENLARSMVEQPAMRMLQEAGRVMQQQVPPEKREAIGKSIETDIRKFVEESVPIMRERAIKLAPSTIGATLEEKFTEDELRQLINWLESPVNKKYLQLGPEMQSNFTQKLVAEARPVIDPRLQALETKVRATLGGPAAGPASSAPAKAAAPAKKASGK